MIKLTKMETKIMNATRANEFEDAYQSEISGPWTFSVIENSKIDPKKAKGVISSLVKKELIEISGEGEETMVLLTEAGKKIFEEADGLECKWGGPKLLVEEDLDKKEKKESNKARFLKGNKNEDNVFPFSIEANSKELLEQISDKMEEKAKEYEVDVQFSKCVDEKDGWYIDTFPIKYEYGSFTETRKILGQIWKDTKKELGYK